MNQIHRSKKPAHGNDDDESEEMGEENSFEGENKIFQLKSEIHSLQIQKNRLALEHQSSIVDLQEANQHLTAQYNLLRRQNTKQLTVIKKLEDELESLKGISENSNRRSAEFHIAETESNTPLIQSPSNLNSELLQKDKIIEELIKKLQHSNQQSVSLVYKKPVDSGEGQREMQEIQIANLKSLVDDLKSKQIIEKRQYQIMIQTKDEIIRKMSTQNDELSLKLAESIENIVGKLKAEIQQLQYKNSSNLQEINSLKEDLKAAQKENQKIKAQFKTREEILFNQYEAEKEELARGLNEKLKKHFKEKEQKISKSEEAFLQLENQSATMRQQNGKLKAEIFSLNKLNEYLQATNRQYEESKKNLQLSLYEKQKQIGQIKQKHFLEISEVHQTQNKERQESNQRIQKLTLELLQKNSILLQYEQSNNTKNLNLNQSIQKQFEKVTKQKQTLEAALVTLQNRYEQKSQKLLNVEKRIRKEYQQRINGLQAELISSRQSKMNENQKTRDPTVYDKSSLLNQRELQKIIDISELRSLEIEDKQRQVKRILQEKITLERENEELKYSIFQFQRKMKEKAEDHKNLQVSFEELGQKYRKDVKELHIKIEEMKEQIAEEKKKAERRKSDACENEQNLSQQIKKYKQQIKELEEEANVYKNQKISEAQETDLKLQRLAYEIQSQKKQKQETAKVQEQKNKQKQLTLLETNKKLQQYVDQLEENMSSLTKKLSAFEVKSRKNYHSAEKQLKQVKMEYSQALREMNRILQKYRKLQDAYSQTLSGYQTLKDERESLNIKYLQVYNERSRVLNDLNLAYDQINKLNALLMSKQEQTHKSHHFLQYPHDHNPKYSQIQRPICLLSGTNMGFQRIPSPNYRERSQSIHNLQSSSKLSSSKLSKYY